MLCAPATSAGHPWDRTSCDTRSRRRPRRPGRRGERRNQRLARGPPGRQPRPTELLAHGYSDHHVAAHLGRSTTTPILSWRWTPSTCGCSSASASCDRVRLLRSFDPAARPHTDVPDPYYGTKPTSPRLASPHRIRGPGHPRLGPVRLGETVVSWMSALRVLLRPGWIALGLVVVAFAALCFHCSHRGSSGRTHRRPNATISSATRSRQPRYRWARS